LRSPHFQIGKTSGLVMTLTGILKNILLVIISVMIWHTSITGIQFLGYAVALAGLVYYSVGWDQIAALGLALWGSARGGYEALRGGPPSGGAGDAEDAQQQGGRLPAAVKRGLIMGVAAVVVLVLAGGFFYGGGAAVVGAQFAEVGTSR
jgi:hypothetical protein